MKGILGRKIEMTQIFSVDGKMIPVTVVQVEPNKVLQVRTIEKDGYSALKLGTGEKRENLINKPDKGNFNKANSTPKRFIKEIRDMNGYEIGNDIKVSDVFKVGEFVDVTGLSKGKGTAGVIKKDNYSRGPMGHGSGYHRGIGSMGPIINRILKSKKMPGRLGHDKTTIQNLEVISVLDDVILIKGSIPGPKKSFVVIKGNVKGIKDVEGVNLLVRNESNDSPAKAQEAVDAPKVEEVVAPVEEVVAPVEEVKEESAE